ncbi:hypothetical protein [Rheinheimera sp. MMS21-TC3]|uniref:hypothetical protein n=1 Tax=Rheinheimera sp. MMS21-TC3 TaxID=3072790 RepID=UPI0028C43A8D|nr:hypothetical protein [Rheinheimera sp. MMS21-TC3]WNO60046.1 hypothetical protein RDV63_03560 [Rheinheimera sp. MMS21-TC3]
MTLKLNPLFGLFLLILLTLTSLSQAQEVNLAAPEQTVLRIGVKEAPPFVMYDGTEYSGLSIDLW